MNIYSTLHLISATRGSNIYVQFSFDVGGERVGISVVVVMKGSIDSAPRNRTKLIRSGLRRFRPLKNDLSIGRLCIFDINALGKNNFSKLASTAIMFKVIKLVCSINVQIGDWRRRSIS